MPMNTGSLINPAVHAQTMPFRGSKRGLQSMIHHRSTRVCRNGTVALRRFANRPERLILATSDRTSRLIQGHWVSTARTASYLGIPREHEICSDPTWSAQGQMAARNRRMATQTNPQSFDISLQKSMIHNFSHGGFACIDLSRLGIASTNDQVSVGLVVDVGSSLRISAR